MEFQDVPPLEENEVIHELMELDSDIDTAQLFVDVEMRCVFKIRLVYSNWIQRLARLALSNE